MDADSTFARGAQSSSLDRPYAPGSMKVSLRTPLDVGPTRLVESAAEYRPHPYQSVSPVGRFLHRRRSHLHKDHRCGRTDPSSPALNCARSGSTSLERCYAATPVLHQMFREYVLARSSYAPHSFSPILFLFLFLFILFPIVVAPSAR